jgi:FlaA1/EpsC-like NDP-sugar epimerase
MINLPFKYKGVGTVSALYEQLEQLIMFSNRRKYTILAVTDLSLFVVSIATAIAIEYGLNLTPSKLWQQVNFVVIEIGFKMGFFWGFNIYQQVLRYPGGDFIFTMVKAILASCLVVAITDRLFLGSTLPTSLLFNDGMLSLILTIAFRQGAWGLLGKIKQIDNLDREIVRVVIYGAGSAGCLFAQALARSNGKKLIAFVDDNPDLQGRTVQGKQVYAPAELLKLQARKGFEEIIISMSSIDNRRKRDLSKKLQILGVPVKVLPSMAEFLNGNTSSIERVQKLNIEDLLGRKAIASYPELLQKDITNRVVLVTGGGGSIGSELCRQIAKQQPKLLIVYELHEFALYQMDLELEEHYPKLNKVAYLGSVTDAQALTRAIERYHVDTIYHAAAYKHVPIVEANPIPGTINNICGTLTAAQCAIDCQVAKFVLISTDKAVRPTNVMGATKRVAELVVQGLADLTTHNTRFTIVRFGNVLGSSGSVVPRFREQITSGKSITLTHLDITRYFMTIPEAASLVIQAGAMSQGGEVFLLEMGEPIKIYDLAVKMIRLHGMEPDRDVKIEVTGLRPGEKIYEELLIDCNAALPTEHPKIFCAREAKLDWSDLSPQLTNLLNSAADAQVNKCVSIIHELVPEYQPMGQYAKIKLEASETLAVSISDKLKKAKIYHQGKLKTQTKSADRDDSNSLIKI